MADRLVVMSNGRVQQIGSQRDLYENPANTFVAGFVGRTNFLRGRVESPASSAARAASPFAAARAPPAHGRTLALRPERLSLATAPVAGADNCFPGIVEFASYLGGVLEYYVRLTPQDRLMVQAPNRFADPAHASAIGSICTGRRRPASCLPMMAAARADRRNPSRDREASIMEKHSSDHHAAPIDEGGRRARRRRRDRRLVARTGTVRRARRARHLGRRLFEAAVEEHRHAADGAEEVRSRARHRRRSGAPRQDARRSAAAARHERPAGTFRRADVRDERRRPVPARRLREDPERAVPAAADEISVRRRAHLLGQGHSLQPEAHQRRRPRASPTRSIRSTATSSASSTSSTSSR